MKNKVYSLYEVKEAKTIKELITQTSIENKAKAFFYTKRKEVMSVTYEHFFNDINNFGTALYAMNLRNTKIAVLGSNSYQWILSYFSIVMGGNTVVPLDKELSAKELSTIIQESKCKAIIYDDNYSDVIEEIKKQNTHLEKYMNMNEEEVYIEKGKQCTDARKEFIHCKINPSDLASIVYTSGTTGKSKGVMLTHYNIVSNAIDASKFVEFSDTAMLVLPLHHMFSIVASLLVPLTQGVPIYINTSLKRLQNDFKIAKPQNMALVPLFVENLHKKIWDGIKEQNKTTLVKTLIVISNCLLKVGIDLRRVLFKKILSVFGGNLDLLICGGAMLDEKYIKEFRAFGINLLNGYGITECSPVVSVNRNNHYKDGSVGQVLPGFDIKIDSTGEILVKGNSVMKGYYNNDNETNLVFKDDWFKTGDLGYIDKESFLYITGRVKNLIILANGKNVSPEELEIKLMTISGIKEVLVYSDKSKILAQIYPDHEYMSEEGIEDVEGYLKEQIDIFNKNIASYKQISSIKLRDTEFNKTTTKKIKRKVSNQ